MFDSRPTVAWPPTTVAWPFSDFFQNFPKLLESSKNVVWQSADGRVTSDHCRVTVQRLFSKFSQIAWNVQKTLFDSQPTVAWPPTTVAWPFSDFFQKFFLLLETFKKRCLTVGRRSRDLNHWRVTVQRLFSKFSQIAWNVHKRCLTVSRRSRDLRPLSRDRSATFFKIFPNCLKRPKTLFDSQPTVAWPPTTVAWPFSDFFQNFPKSLETSKKRCLTVSRRSRDLRPLSRDRSATFFKNFSYCLKRSKNVVWQSADGRVTSTTDAWPFSDFFQNFPKLLETSINVVWQSADGRVTSDHCRVTVQRLFSKFSQIAWNVQKRCLTVSRRSRDLRPLSRDRSATFFKIFPNRLKRPKNVVWQSADGRVTSDHCRVTVQRLFSKKFLIAWNVEKSLFDSRPTVAWPQPLSRDRSATFFQNFPKSLETSKKRCLTVGRRSRDLRPLSRDRSATFFKKISNCLKRPKIVVWQSADGRVTSTTVAWPCSDFFQNFPKSFETSKKRCLTVGRRSRDLRPLSRDRSATFFKKISNCLKRRKIVAWPSADSRVTSDHCHVTVQRLFSKKFLIAWNVEKSLFDSRPTVASP